MATDKAITPDDFARRYCDPLWTVVTLIKAIQACIERHDHVDLLEDERRLASIAQERLENIIAAIEAQPLQAA